MKSLTSHTLEQLEVQREFNVSKKLAALKQAAEFQKQAAEFDEAAVQCQNAILEIRRSNQDIECLASRRASRTIRADDPESAGRTYIGIAEAARMNGLAPTTIQGWCRSGSLLGKTRRYGRHWQIDREAFRALAASRNFLPTD